MTIDLKFCWYAPTHGDGYIIGGRTPGLEWSVNYINDVAAAAEATGFDMILIPAGPGCADVMLTASHIAHVTSTLRFLVAVRTGSVPPTIFAKSASTLDQLSGGRVSVNIVTGGSPMELAMDGDHEPHERRYRRTEEFMTVLRTVWGGDDVSHDGEFSRICNATFAPKPVQPGGPRLYLGGSSEGAITAAAHNADVYLMWGEPSTAVEEQIRKVQALAGESRRALRFGMRINLIVDETSTAAWRRADEMLCQVDPTMADRAQRYLRDSDSIAQARIQALSGPQDEEPTFWTGMVPFRSGNSTALVGSVDEVVSSLRHYVAAGVSEFIFSSYPHLDTVDFIGARVLPALRNEFNQRLG